MPLNLKVKKVDDQNIDQVGQLAVTSKHVNMHYAAKSKRKALLSGNFANCLCVVIHDAVGQQGVLMHIFPAFTGGVNQERSFEYLDNLILSVINAFPRGAEIDVLLWKGVSYTPMKENKYTMSYAAHLESSLQANNQDHVKIIDKMDYGKLSAESAILYDPKTGNAFIMSQPQEMSLPTTPPVYKSKRAGMELPILLDQEVKEVVVATWSSAMFKPRSKMKVPTLFRSKEEKQYYKKLGN